MGSTQAFDSRGCSGKLKNKKKGAEYVLLGKLPQHRIRHMKNIFKAYLVRSALLVTLCLGGSVQASQIAHKAQSYFAKVANIFRPSTPAASALALAPRKSIFSNHPILTYGGLGLLAGVAAFAAIEGWRAHGKGENVGTLAWKDISSAARTLRVWIYPTKADLTEVQQKIQDLTKQIQGYEASMKGYFAETARTAAENLTKEREALLQQEKSLAKRLGSLTLEEKAQKLARIKRDIDRVYQRLSPLQGEHDQLKAIERPSVHEVIRIHALESEINELTDRLDDLQGQRDEVPDEETAKAEIVEEDNVVEEDAPVEVADQDVQAVDDPYRADSVVGDVAAPVAASSSSSSSSSSSRSRADRVLPEDPTGALDKMTSLENSMRDYQEQQAKLRLKGLSEALSAEEQDSLNTLNDKIQEIDRILEKAREELRADYGSGDPVAPLTASAGSSSSSSSSSASSAGSDPFAVSNYGLDPED